MSAKIKIPARTLLIILALLFFQFTKAQMTFINYPSQNIMNAVAEDGSYIWIGTNGGAFKRNKGTGVLAQILTVNNSGIVYNWINAIVVDPQGNKWFGTNYGLSRYNEQKNEWTTFEKNKVVWSMCIDLDGNLWYGSWGAVSKFNGTGFTKYNLPSSATGKKVTAIVTESSGVLWIASDGGGVHTFDGSQWGSYTTSNSDLLSDNVKGMTIDAEGTKWIGTTGGLCSYNKTWTDYSAQTGSVSAVAVDGSGNVWAATWGVKKFDGSIWEQYTTSNSDLCNDNINAIITDSNGKKWFGTEYGLSSYDDVNWQCFITENCLIHTQVNDIAVDQDGHYWFGTYDGISEFDNVYWTAHFPFGGWITDIEVDTANNVWVANWYAGIAKYDGTSWEVYNTSNSSIISNAAKVIYIDEENMIWIGTEDGISIFDGSTWDQYTTADGLISNDITAITRDTNDIYWIGTKDGMSSFDGTSTWNSYTTADGLPHNTISDIDVDDQNRKWVCTSTYIGLFDDTNWQTITIQGSKIAIDTFDIKWITTSVKQQGLIKYDGSNKVYYTTEDGLPTNWTASIMIDGENNKWIGTISGATKAFCSPPEPDFTYPAACYSETAPPTVFTNTSSKVDLTTLYQWDIYDNDTIDYFTTNASHKFPDYGFYDVRLIAINDNCNAEIIKNVEVGSLPDISITYTGDTDICLGDNITLTAEISNYHPELDYDYEWSNGSSLDKITVSIPGDYSVEVSNEECTGQSQVVNVNTLEPFNEEQICMVTVDPETNKNLIIWEKTPDKGISSYNVYKLFGTNYIPIGNVPFNNLSVFIDYSSNPQVNAARYAISVVDTCGNESDKSYYHQTIHLGAAEGAQPNTIVLDWTEYIDESSGFIPDWYYIFRGPSSTNLTLYDSVSSAFTEWNDLNSEGYLYYQVGVKFPTLCAPTGNLKAGAGPYSHSISNLEDNRLQEVQNQAPADIAISCDSISENFPVGTLVGKLSTTDPNEDDTHTYSFATGQGEDDNAKFVIVGDMLLSAESFDFELKDSCTIRIKSTDQGALSYEKIFIILITDLDESIPNEPPTNINLSNNQILENSPANTIIGQFQTTDPDVNDTHIYSLVTGEGDTDNKHFKIVGDLLLSSEVFDYEYDSLLTVRVRSVDHMGQYVEDTFQIIINDVEEQADNHAPSDIQLDYNNIDENMPVGSLVGRLTCTDSDSNDNHTFKLVSGTGDDDNSSFTILGDLLLSASLLDYELKDSLSVRVRVTDDGSGKLYYEKQFTITVNDLVETGLRDLHNNTLKIYPNPFSDYTTIRFTNPSHSEYRLLVRDLAGKVVMMIAEITEDDVIIERSSLKAGYYSVEIVGENIFRGKMIVE